MAQRSLRAQVTESESRRKRVEFIEALRGNKQIRRLPMSVRAACDHVGVSRVTVRRWREMHPEFALAYEDAMEDGTDVLEDEASRRAMGFEEPIFGVTDDGEQVQVGARMRYSDDLLKFILSGRRPERYRPNYQVNTQVNVLEQPSDRDVAKALSLLLEEAKTQQETVDHG